MKPVSRASYLPRPARIIFTMPLAPGTRLEHYEIAGPLGSGGMGEVYRAQDTRLRREVAIKILPPRFACDPSRLARFEREAQVLAALNHPNIAAIYGLENAGGIHFLVLELVEGPTLAERIASGAIPLDDALRIATQIAEALEAAHDKGIVHRDLKPANVKVTPDSKVKVLDFGLAAVVQPQMSESADPANSPTITMAAATQAGVILGTAPYMSPEQARGSNVDKRADIWGFGVVLYEMVTGRRLFRGDTISDTLASVLKEQPDLDHVPARVRRLLQSCLEKDPRKRLRDIADWRLPLESESPGPPLPSGGRNGAVYVFAALVTLALAALAFIHFREKPPLRELMRFEISAPANTTYTMSRAPVVSPDGRKLAFIATGADRKPMIWVRSLDTEEARPLAGTEAADQNTLIWSPESRYLAFVSGAKLKKIEAAGGPAQMLCEAPTAGTGVWMTDNRILFGGLAPLQLVSAAGGTPTPLTTVDHSRGELGHDTPVMLPDGRHFLYVRIAVPFENGGVYTGSLDLKPDQQSSKRLLPDVTSVVYVPSPVTGDSPGLLLFVRGITLSDLDNGGTLMAQPFDPKRMEFTGDAVPIAQQVGIAGFSASPAGVLAFATTGAQGNSQLTWVDRKGAVLSTAGDVGEYRDLALSPDGARVAYERGTDLWLFEFARGGLNTKFTFGNPSQFPAWSSDGSHVVFTSIRETGFGIYQKASNLAGQEELLFQSPAPKAPSDLTHDGKFLMFNALSSDGKLGDLWVIPTGGSPADRKPLSFLRTQFEEGGGRFSPDARWVAYESDQSGKTEIYVLPFDESNPGSSAGALHQVSKEGGRDVHWSGDGKELFYMAPDGYLMSVAVSVVGRAFQAGTPQRLFKSPAAAGSYTWDVSKDGKKFLIAAPASSSGASASASQPLHVVVNWTELLKR